jgi:HSP20 family protein
LENSTAPAAAAGAFHTVASVGESFPGIQALRVGGLSAALVRQPSVEIRDNGKEFVVRAELPGMSKEDIEVHATEGALHVLAHQEDDAIEAGQLVSAERLAKQLERNVALPEYVVPSKAVAAFRDGVLEVTLPKKHPGEPAQRLTLK